MFIVERYNNGKLDWQEKCFTFESAQECLADCFCINIEDGLSGGDTAKLCGEYAEICYRGYQDDNKMHIVQWRIVKEIK